VGFSCIYASCVFPWLNQSALWSQQLLQNLTHVDIDMNAMHAAFSLCIQAHGSDVISLHLSAHLVYEIVILED